MIVRGKNKITAGVYPNTVPAKRILQGPTQMEEWFHLVYVCTGYIHVSALVQDHDYGKALGFKQEPTTENVRSQTELGCTYSAMHCTCKMLRIWNCYTENVPIDLFETWVKVEHTEILKK